MTICLPAYHGDKSRKAEILLRAQNTDWQICLDLDAWLPDAARSDGRAGSAFHAMTGFPASLTRMAGTILRNLPPDRRGRFMAAFFEAPDAGADLAPIADRFLAAVARMLQAHGDARHRTAMAVKDYAPELVAIMARSQADNGAFGWMDCADLLIEALAAAVPP